MEAQLTIGAGELLQSKRAKRVEDIIYDADTKKHLRRPPAGSIRGVVD